MEKRELLMKSDLRDRISTAATAIEIGLGVLILLACVLAGIGLICTTELNTLFTDTAYLQHRMSDACIILIGVELIKMITSYTIDSVVDVMLVAVARQMIVEHTSPMENLMTVATVGILFVIRKYLYVSQIDRRRTRQEIEDAIRAEVVGEEGEKFRKKVSLHRKK